MSAPKDAYVIGDTTQRNENSILCTPVICKCGWQGSFCQLLGHDDHDQQWCPQCRKTNWKWDTAHYDIEIENFDEGESTDG